MRFSLSEKWVQGVVVAGAFVLVAFVLYGQSLHYKFIAWDEISLIFKNPIVKEMSPRSIAAAFSTYDPELYIPLTMMSYQIDYAIGGLDPFMFRFQNILLHGLNTFLVAWVVSLLLAAFTEWNDRKRWGTGIAIGLLFVLHPLHTEAVAWVVGRKDLLSTFFYLLAFGTYLRWRESMNERTYLLSIVFFVLALLAKPMALSLLPVIVLFELIRGEGDWAKRGMRLLPYLGLSVLFGIVALIGKQGISNPLSTVENALMAQKSLWFYVQKLLWPTNLAPMYPYEGDISIASAEFFVPLLLGVALLGSIAFLWRRQRAVAFGLAFFVLTLLPTFFNVVRNSEIYFASDRYAYIPSIGFFIAAASIILMLNDRYIRRPWPMWAALVIILALLSYQTSVQIGYWRSTKTIFDRTLELYPRALSAHVNLALVSIDAGNFEEAEAHLQAAQEIDPLPVSWNALASISAERGDSQNAIRAYEEALALEPTNIDARIGLGNVYIQTGDTDKAIWNLERVLEINPSHAGVLNTLGQLHLESGRTDDAVEMLTKAVQADPTITDYHFNLSIALAKKGSVSEAIRELEEVLRLNPGDAQAERLLEQLRKISQ